MTAKIYYCDTCFHIHGKIVTMETDIVDEETGASGWHLCPDCGGSWKINRGQARHVVSLKLQHYTQLAHDLGILEIDNLEDAVQVLKVLRDSYTGV